MLLLVNKVSFIVDFYHGAHQPVRDFEVLEDIQYVHLLILRLWMTDVSDVNQQILEVCETQALSQHTLPWKILSENQSHWTFG